MANLTMAQWQKKLERWGGNFDKVITESYEKISPMLISCVQRDYLSGQVLGVRSGKLKGSIRTILEGRKMFLGTDVSYGAIHMNKGRDFLNPPIQKKMSKIKQIILDGIIEEYNRS